MESSLGQIITPDKNDNRNKDSANIINSSIVQREQLQDDKSKTNIDSQEKQQEVREIWFFELFRFATRFDVILMVVGSIAALGMGVALPSFSYIWGQMTDSFAKQDMVEASKSTLLTFIWVGLGAFGAGWLMFACWMIAGERQAIACRKAYLRSLLRQEVGWFDMLNQTELASKFAKDTFAFQGAIGQKISTLIMTVGTLISGFVFAFVTGWLMTLVLLASLPALAILGGLYMKAIGNKDKQQQAAYSKAGGRAEQALSSIKTVKQLNGQQFQKIKYSQCLEQASKQSLKFLLCSAAGIGGLFFCMLASYSFGFWYGSKCILNTNDCPSSISKQNYTAGNVLVVFFSVVMAGFNLSQLTPAFRKISQGRQAAARIFEIIDRKPLIQNPQNGLKLQNLQGKIKFQNVTFSYPKDKSRIIFKNINLQFDINKTGLVGQSGCGKSTALQLIMRFYDPDQGKVTLDGHDLRQLDLKWLREQIGYVGQEPVLFATSIRENLSFGNQKATQKEIQQALKMAEAYEFVQQLENKLDTYVGYGGGQLSGGQKQRIAIARAILRKPKIILLDEATSALDRRNQKLIQATLERITTGITTITVAHRVKTIMNSDIIYVLDKGGVAQKGKFKDLTIFKNQHHQIQQQEHKPQQKHQSNKIANIQSNQQDIQQINLENAKPEVSILDLTKTKQEKQKQQNARLLQKYQKAIFSRLFGYSTQKVGTFVFGTIVSVINGGIFPVFSIFLARMLTALLDAQIFKNASKELGNINLYALIFLLLGIGAFFLTTIQIFCFEKVGVQITKKLRLETYYKMLRMPIKWYDLPKNNAGTLSARLETDCQIVHSMTTTVVQIMIQNLSTLITGIIIAFIYQWRTSLVALGLLPLMIIAGIIQMSFNTGFSDKTDAAYKDSSSLIMQAMINIRTVSSFGYQGIVATKYDQKMQQPYALAIKKGNASGFFFGTSQFVMFIIFGLLFYLGAIFVRDNKGVTVTDMFTAVYAIMFAGMTAGNNSHFMPDTAACKNSAANLFEILDSQDQQQLQIQQKSQMIKKDIEKGDIILNNISFKYQSRNDYVFKNLSINIKNGSKVAFVGASGCGKSTILQLLLRFYDPQDLQKRDNQINLGVSSTEGSIIINGVNIKDYQLHYLRNSFGVVSQEPVLFNGSFKENIRYNLKESQVTDQQIDTAAQLANAKAFIMGSEELGNAKIKPEKGDEIQGKGYDRNVGVKGSHISGGQKQRVAIARAILRNPHRLLLDEATSALDNTNQKKVQKSLDEIMIGKTVISVAHRIETIKNADEIFVFEKGRIVQSGKYSELVNKKGYFYKLERGTEFI